MSEATRWARLRRGVRVGLKLLLLGIGVYLAIGFVAIRTVRDPVTLSAPGPVRTEAAAPTERAGGTLIRGAISVHTGRSHDAEGTLEEVAEAASAAGLDFVILGDHVGDWAEGGASLLEPRRVEGVLLVPGLELVVRDVGRVLAVGLDTLPREWLGSVGELAREVRARDGFLSVVHPRSPRNRERWHGLPEEGIDAWESFDISEMARLRQDEPLVGYRIAGILASMAVGRGHTSIARFWKEGTATPALLAYDSARSVAPVALTGGLNHHPKARLFGRLMPPYAPFFRTVVNHVRLDAPLDQDPLQARSQLLEGLREGRLFVTLEDAEEVQDFDFRATDGGGEAVGMGGIGAWTGEGVLGVRLPRGVRRPLVRILRDGMETAWLEGRGGEVVEWALPGPGSYRVEVFRPGWKVGGLRLGFRPWIVSNPVELQPQASGEAPEEAQNGTPGEGGDEESPASEGDPGEEQG